MRVVLGCVALAALLLVGCGDGDTGQAGAASESSGGDAASAITITDAVIGEPAGPNAALYFTVQNDGEETGIVAVRTDAVETATLHENVREDGQLVMSAVDDALPLPPGPTVLEPGGLHVMLTGAGVSDLAAGDVVPVTVELSDGSMAEVDAAVVPLTELVAEDETSETTGDGAHGHDSGE
jgi:copper(I)-binding protein